MTGENWSDLGRRRLSQGHGAIAVVCFRKALALRPAEASELNNLGMSLKSSGDPAGGARSYRRSHAVDPSDVAPLNNLANALAADGDRTSACTILREVLRRAPWFAECHQNLGDHLRHLKHFDEAASALRTALALKPDLALSHTSVAATALVLGDAVSAIAGYRRAFTLAPSAGVHSDLLFALSYASSTTSDALFAEHRRWAIRHAGDASPRLRLEVERSARHDKLRVGYVSADLRDHPVARNLIGLIEAHDRQRYEVIIYPEITGSDAITDRFRTLAAGWRPTQGLTDETVAELVRRDQIDILVFVAGHTGMNRITLAAHSAAPVQVSIYAPSTTGLPQVDAWLTDPILSPDDSSERFVETLIHLPSLFLHQPPTNAPRPSPKHGNVVFASFNNPAKHTSQVYRLWARILSATPGSRLRLKYRGVYRTPSLRRQIVDIFDRQGVGADRLEFAIAMDSRDEHLAGLSEVDIALDPFPFNGCNTTFEALWMGVPVVTRAGDRFLSRMSASFLAQIGLMEMIAHDDDGYVAAAATLAADSEKRAALRLQLRERIAASRLCDPVAHARSVEGAYLKLWQDKVLAAGAAS